MKEHGLVQLNNSEGLVKRQTLAVEHSARAAYIAIGASVFALVISVLAYIKAPEPLGSAKSTSSMQMSLSVGNSPQKPASAPQ